MAASNPADARVHALLAQAAQALARGRLADAERDVLGALALAPANLQARHLRAMLWQRAGRPDRAAEVLRQALAQHPTDVALLNSLGACLQALGENDAALDAFRRACESAPHNAVPRANLGKLLVDSGSLQQGIVELEAALALDPSLVGARFTLAYACRVEGRFDAAATQLRHVLERQPHDGNAWLGLTDMDAAIDDADLECMQQGYASDQVHGRTRIALGFALAHALETRERETEAWEIVRSANAAVRASEPWSAVAARERCTATIAAFASAPATIAEAQGAEVIFVVGMPRSGSTLVEQILSSHPEVEGAGELADLPAVISAELRRCGGLTLPQWADSATAADWQRLGRDYLARTERWRRSRPRCTDKLPGNWLLVGALRRMLPAARVVVCRRDPLETSLACFARLFAPQAQPFSYDLDDIASYWHDFDRAVAAWNAQGAGFVYEQQHEALLAEPEARIRALLAFCGLPFDAACLQFHQCVRAVRTHSAAQVRQPLRATHSRAARYGALLDPLKAALARAPLQT